MKKFHLLITILGFQFHSFSQTIFKLNYGGSNDHLLDVITTNDNGYIFLGARTSPGSSNDDILLVKLNNSGLMEWSKTYGDTGMDWGMSIAKDGSGFIISGGSEYQGANYLQVFLMKVDSVGNLIWINYYPSTSRSTAALSIIKTSTNEFVAGGMYLNGAAPMFYESDAYLLKFDSIGELIWAKRFGGPNDEEIEIVKETFDGGYILTGEFMFVTKVDSGGNIEWSKNYTGSGLQYINSIELTSDSGYIVAGNASFSMIDSKAFLLKLDSTGNITWAKLYGGTYDAGFSSAFQTADGGFLAGGGADSNNFSRPFMVKTDAIGDTVWTRDYLDSAENAVLSMIIDNDGYAVFSSENYHDHSEILKISPGVDFPCLQMQMHFPSSVPIVQIFNTNYSMVTESTNPFYASLQINNGDSTTMKCYDLINKLDVVKSNDLFSVFPNPAENEITIQVNSNDNFKYQLMNSLGEIIIENDLTNNNSRILLNGIPAAFIFSSSSIQKQRSQKS